MEQTLYDSYILRLLAPKVENFGTVASYVDVAGGKVVFDYMSYLEDEYCVTCTNLTPDQAEKIAAQLIAAAKEVRYETLEIAGNGE